MIMNTCNVMAINLFCVPCVNTPIQYKCVPFKRRAVGSPFWRRRPLGHDECPGVHTSIHGRERAGPETVLELHAPEQTQLKHNTIAL